MQSVLRRSVLAVTSLSMLALLVVVATAADQAPTGTYTATIGGSVGTARASDPEKGTARRTKQGSPAAGNNVTINLSSYSTQDEISQLKAVPHGDVTAFLSALSKFNHGSVTIGDKSFPINAAHSAQLGAKYVIRLVSAHPLMAGTTARGRTVMGSSGGMIKLTVDSSGAGEGVLYRTAQVVVKDDDEIDAKAGSSTATQLTGVARK